ncbi:hypothetical protein ABB02_00379 [Clostridiaceae bacterium JG1575]|nr:hypothetical protein ABB02_00379 [Clostridiaceae bacterium JG1575]
MQNTNRITQVTVKGALLIAISFILTYFEFPILPTAPWLKLDFSTVPLLLGALALGPAVGVGLTLILQFLLFLTSSNTGGIGQLANFIIISIMILVTTGVYRRWPSFKGLVFGALVGTAAFSAAAVLVNQFLLVPLFFPKGFPGGPAAQRAYLYGLIPLFNGIKGLSVAFFSSVLYHRLERFLKVEKRMLPKKPSGGGLKMVKNPQES